MSTRILLDMDGVITDFIGGALKAHSIKMDDIVDAWPSREWDIVSVLGMTNAEFWEPLDNVEFWAGLHQYQWFDELMAKIANVGPFTISSTPSCSPWCAAGKLIWLQARFGFKFKDYMLGGAKHLMAKGDKILIDDNDSNVLEFRAEGGRAILVPQHWNSNHQLCDRRMEYVCNCLEEARIHER